MAYCCSAHRFSFGGFHTCDWEVGESLGPFQTTVACWGALAKQAKAFLQVGMTQRSCISIDLVVLQNWPESYLEKEREKFGKKRKKLGERGVIWQIFVKLWSLIFRNSINIWRYHWPFFVKAIYILAFFKPIWRFNCKRVECFVLFWSSSWESKTSHYRSCSAADWRDGTRLIQSKCITKSNTLL